MDRNVFITSKSIRKSTRVVICLVTLGLLITTCRFQQNDLSYAVFEKGIITPNIDFYGNFYLYTPTTLGFETEILVVIHGTPAKDQSAEETALYYAEHWVTFAEEHDLILLVPAFNQADFSSRKGEITDALTGYRGLFGREIGADEWVIRLVDKIRLITENNEPIYLYGHSAGGQFVGRFLVTHPDQVKRGVISAAVTYPQPDSTIPWPYGMGPLSGEIVWEDGTSAEVGVLPDPETWLKATQIPITVIVGLNDLEPQLSRPGQEGRVRPVIGKNWVEAMRVFAAEHGLESQIAFEAVSGAGHSMLGLLPYTHKALITD
jgi:pimeloyl-ACP methyl ester carboxylesterase